MGRRFKMTAETTTKKLYDLNEALEIIPMSKAGLYLACSQGKIATVRIGKRIFIPAWFIDQLLQKPSDA